MFLQLDHNDKLCKRNELNQRVLDVWNVDISCVDISNMVDVYIPGFYNDPKRIGPDRRSVSGGRNLLYAIIRQGYKETMKLFLREGLNPYSKIAKRLKFKNKTRTLIDRAADLRWGFGITELLLQYRKKR